MDILLQCKDQLFVRVNGEYFRYPHGYDIWIVDDMNTISSKLWYKVENVFEQYPEITLIPYQELKDRPVFYRELKLANLIPHDYKPM